MSRIAGLLNSIGRAPPRGDMLVAGMLGRYPGSAVIQAGPAGAVGRVAPPGAGMAGGIAEADGLLVAIDGCILNSSELRAGLRLQAPGDAVLVAAMVRRHGMAGAMARFSGDFAIAALDPAAGRLWLARDRFGVKPLYWALLSGGVAFASQPRSLLQLPGVSADLNVSFVARFAASHYRTFDNIHDESPYRAIHQVPASAVVELTGDGNARSTTYWALEDRAPFTQNETELAEAYRERLLRAVQRRLPLGTRVAFSLSGGLDSSSVVSAAERLTGKRQEAASCIYTDTTYDEREQIQDVVSSKVSQWHRVELGNAIDLTSIVARLVRLHDEPVATATWLSHLLLAENLKSLGFDAMAGGLGGDELNAGEYEYFPMHFADLRAAKEEALLAEEIDCWARHHDHPIHRKNPIVAEAMMRRLTDASQPGRCLPDMTRMLRYSRVLRPEYFDLGSFAPVMDAPFSSYLKNRAYQDMFRETLPCCLRAQDRHCAALGMESFNPFLDHELAELMFSVPGKFKIRRGVTKQLLRQAMKGILPEATRTRIKKTGWNAPAHRWFSAATLNDLKDRVQSASFRDRGIYDPAAMMRVIDDHVRIVDSGADEENHMMFLWQLVNLESWMDALPEIGGSSPT